VSFGKQLAIIGAGMKDIMYASSKPRKRDILANSHESERNALKSFRFKLTGLTRSRDYLGGMTVRLNKFAKQL